MKLAVMQPYFFPYIGYFQLMSAVDQWIVFDDTQYINKGWVNRNRILHPDIEKEWQYITIPLKNRQRTDKINAVFIDKTKNWRANILGKLSAYKRKAPYFHSTMNFVYECLTDTEENLAQFLTNTMERTAMRLRIRTPIARQSALSLALGTVDNPGHWALRICRALRANEYINPHGGSAIFDERDYDSAGIQLWFLKPTLRKYIQCKGSFTPGLSILDVMMWNSLDQIEEMIRTDYKLLRKSEL